MSSMSEIFKKLADHSLLSKVNIPDSNVESVGVRVRSDDGMETETNVVNDEIKKLSRGADDDFFTRVKAFASAPKRMRTDKFEKMPKVDFFTANKRDWKDKELKNLKIFRLEKLGHHELVLLGRATFKKIHEGVSKRAVANLFILAYNLMDGSGIHIIDDYEPELVDITNFLNPDEVSDATIVVGQSRGIEIREGTPNGRSARERQHFRRAAGYTYLAASYLRLFTKAADNYIKLGNFLRDKFENFYSFSFPFEDHHPDLEVIKAIKKQFEIEQRFKDTLYVFLYASCKNKEGVNLKSFLYKIHLNYTGLHPFMLFFQCMEHLQLDNKALSKLLWTPMFEPQLTGIGDLVVLDSLEDDYSLNMWKFGRIFDKTFMSILQTKNCVTFTLVLAFIILETGKDNKGGPMGIANLQGATKGERRTAYTIALRTISLAKQQVIGDEHAVQRT